VNINGFNVDTEMSQGMGN